MAGKTLDLENITSRDSIAVAISNKWLTWNTYKNDWIQEKREIRNYVFATDTKRTANAALPWKNSTTVPKLCQIRDNLHANYMAALFPNKDWLRWEGGKHGSEDRNKADTITEYIRNKTLQSKFKTTVSQLIYDYIDYGNTFVTTEWVTDYVIDPISTEQTPVYVGPRAVRFSPNDIVFNPLAPSFAESPSIVRSVTTLGELKAVVEGFGNPDEKAIAQEALDKSVAARQQVSAFGPGDQVKDEQLKFDGLGTITEYYGSDYVEILTFYGDLYDITSDKLYKNHIIKIIDQSHILVMQENPSWNGKKPIHHAGWRLRPDDLYAMGPLDNIVGMQYRIDHLENLKADVFDLIAHPVMKIRGSVDEFVYGPGARIQLGDEGDVDFIRPDTTALNADTQISILEQKMEEMAGAPREAMGIRTPGEKTAFEVQTLGNASGRIFQNKTSYFEEMLIEPTLNDMLELSRRLMDGSDVIRTLDSATGAILFRDITKEDIQASGRLRPRGASRYARQNNLYQNLTALASSGIYADPSVQVHISGVQMANAVEDLLELEQFDMIEPNIRVQENANTARLQNAAQSAVEEEAITPVEEAPTEELTEEDIVA